MSVVDSLSIDSLRSVPADLAGVVVVVVFANLALFHPAFAASPIRVPVGVLFVLFVPGYALVAVLFPEAGRSPTETRVRSAEAADTDIQRPNDSPIDSFRGLDWWERLALSFALSIAVVPLLGVVVTLSPFEFAVGPVFFAISAFTVVSASVAFGRRLNLPERHRFRVSIVEWVGRVRRDVTEADSRGGVLLNVGLILAVVFAVGTLGFAVAAPPDGETYTEFYVLSETDSGELVAGGYPGTINASEPMRIHTGIENYERTALQYDVVVQIQRVETTDDSVTVTERREIDRFSVVLDHNETLLDERDLTVSEAWTGTDLRIEFLLYRDSVPETPTSESAYRHLHIWVDVQPSETSSATTDGG